MPAASPSPWVVPASLFGIVLASRLPLLGPGFGADGDAWLVLSTARHLAETGEYLTSRLPGYPLFEAAHALLWRAGVRSPFALSLVTALFGALAAVVFHGVCALLVSPRRAAGLALVFAFTPGVWAASCEVIDYLWAVTFALLALRDVLEGRFVRAGVLLGIGIGFRLTTAGFLVPLGVLAGLRAEPGRRLRTVFLLAAVPAGLAAVFYLPLLLRYGTGVLPAALGWQPRYLLFAVRLWEPLGFVALGVGVAWVVARLIRSRPAESLPPGAGPAVFASLAGIVAFGLLFLRHPYEPGYLVPVVPLVLLLFGLVLGGRTLAVLGVVMVASSVATYSPSRGGWEPGGPFYVHSKRAEDLVGARATLRAAEALPDGSIVLTAFYQPIILWELGRGRRTWIGHERVEPTDGRVRFAGHTGGHAIEAVEAWMDAGARVYFVPRAGEAFPRKIWTRGGREYRVEPLPGLDQGT